MASKEHPPGIDSNYSTDASHSETYLPNASSLASSGKKRKADEGSAWTVPGSPSLSAPPTLIAVLSQLEAEQAKTTYCLENHVDRITDQDRQISGLEQKVLEADRKAAVAVQQLKDRHRKENDEIRENYREKIEVMKQQHGKTRNALLVAQQEINRLHSQCDKGDAAWRKHHKDQMQAVETKHKSAMELAVLDREVAESEVQALREQLATKDAQNVLLQKEKHALARRQTQLHIQVHQGLSFAQSASESLLASGDVETDDEDLSTTLAGKDSTSEDGPLQSKHINAPLIGASWAHTSYQKYSGRVGEGKIKVELYGSDEDWDLGLCYDHFMSPYPCAPDGVVGKFCEWSHMPLTVEQEKYIKKLGGHNFLDRMQRNMRKKGIA